MHGLHVLYSLFDGVFGRTANSTNLFGRPQLTIASQVTGHEDGSCGQRIGTTTGQVGYVINFIDNVVGQLFDLFGQVEFGAETILFK